MCFEFWFAYLYHAKRNLEKLLILIGKRKDFLNTYLYHVQIMKILHVPMTSPRHIIGCSLFRLTKRGKSATYITT